MQGIGEHIGHPLLRRHPLRFYREEPSSQPRDVASDVQGDSHSRAVTAACVPCPLRRRRNEMSDARCRRRAGRHRHQRQVIGRDLARQQRKRIRQIHPAPRLLSQRQHVGPRVQRGFPGSARQDRLGSRVAEQILVPQRHVDVASCRREIAQRARRFSRRTPSGHSNSGRCSRSLGDDNEGPDIFTFADPALPGGEKIEALIRRGKLVGLFEAAPDGFRLAHIPDKIDAGNAACLRPRHVSARCRSRPPWSSAQPVF